MEKNSKIAVFGGSGMLGSAVVRSLKSKGFADIYAISKDTEFDLLNKQMIDDFIINIKPDYIFMVAGLVGGILANNSRQADFLYQNSLMILYTLESVKTHSPKTKILYTGSTCIYPKEKPSTDKRVKVYDRPLSKKQTKDMLLQKGWALLPVSFTETSTD
jgi:GDP-L-fucose synthase